MLSALVETLKYCITTNWGPVSRGSFQSGFEITKHGSRGRVCQAVRHPLLFRQHHRLLQRKIKRRMAGIAVVPSISGHAAERGHWIPDETRSGIPWPLRAEIDLLSVRSTSITCASRQGKLVSWYSAIPVRTGFTQSVWVRLRNVKNVPTYSCPDCTLIV